MGIALGALNVLFIAIGMALMEGNAHPGVVVLVVMFGMVPGVLLGAGLGWIAGLMKASPIWLRRFVLLVPAILLVAMLGSEFDLEHFIAMSCIPSVVGVLILERNTRLVAPPIVPPAQVHRA